MATILTNDAAISAQFDQDWADFRRSHLPRGLAPRLVEAMRLAFRDGWTAGALAGTRSVQEIARAVLS